MTKQSHKSWSTHSEYYHCCRQRPLVFVGQRDTYVPKKAVSKVFRTTLDTYILRNEDKELVDAYDKWSTIGKDLEEQPLCLRFGKGQIFVINYANLNPIKLFHEKTAS